MRNVIIALVIGVAFVMPIEWMGAAKSIISALIVAGASMYFLLATDNKKNRAKP